MSTQQQQEQFLEVIDRDEAERRFLAALDPSGLKGPLGQELVSLDDALGRVLSRDVVAEIDVPSFDRSNYDGFAVQAADTFGAQEETPRRLQLSDQVPATGVVPDETVTQGTAMAIATGGMLPRGADAVVMVEHTDAVNGDLLVRKAVTPGFGVTFAGTDIAAGETVLRRGQHLTSRETGVLAAIGAMQVSVWRKPKVAIISTGDEIIETSQAMQPGLVYDSNMRILSDAIRELDAQPINLGIVADDFKRLTERLDEALETADVVLLSGGTSKGQGDVCHRVVGKLTNPGIVAHGVALKPGKPICLAVTRGKPVVILPGFPTSAIFTFHEFVAPIIRRLGGRPSPERTTTKARMAVKVNSEIGRTEYLLVGLVETAPKDVENTEKVSLAAYPMGKGSGSVTSFSCADGFVTIGRYEEIVEAGTVVDVQYIGRDLRVADLVVMGSHCLGLDLLLGKLHDQGFQTKCLAVGSTAGLEAARRGECDLAGIHLLDPDSGQYNRPFVTDPLELVTGYGRIQGIVYRAGDERFEGRTAREAIEKVKSDPECMMVNRNRGSGTRILLDGLLAGTKPNGYAVQARGHNAIAAAVKQGRADWGMAIESVARDIELGFLAFAEELYDFVIPKTRMNRPAVVAFRELLGQPEVREALKQLGFIR